MEYSTKIELGCGRSKTEGYIGVDRFALKGVDVVADLNEKFPFADDSVDVVWACHSLEHLRDINFTMREIFRVLRHEGILMILAPYYWQSINVANHYHLVAFTEEIFRFYNQSKSTQLCDYPNYDNCPHAGIYGLAQSDNSDNHINFEPLYQEFFYYESFRSLSESEKEHARRNLLNVCDQFFTAVAINKCEHSFTEQHLNILREDARHLEPEIVSYMRERDLHWEHAKGSLLSDIDAHIAMQYLDAEKKIADFSAKTEEKFLLQEQKLSEHLTKQNTQFNELLSRFESQCIQYGARLAELRTLYTQHSELCSQLEQRIRRDEIALYAQAYYQEQNRSFIRDKLFTKKNDVSGEISSISPQFATGLAQHWLRLGVCQLLTYSSMLPYEYPVSYEVKAGGNQVHFFLSGGGADICVTIKSNGSTIFDDVLTSCGEGEVVLPCADATDTMTINLRLLEKRGVARVLEITQRKFFIFKTKTLAAFFSD